jgi:opacity protein-like surface antigen
MKRLLVLLLFPAALVFADGLISFGVKGGVPFNDAFHAATDQNIRFITDNNHWTVGPTLDVNLPLGFAVEADLLYRRLRFTQTDLTALVDNATTANAWDLPLLLKFRFAPGPIRPYVSVGPTFRGLTNVSERIEGFLGQSTLKDRFNTGFTLSGGLKLLGHISPEIRYTRWGWDNFKSVGGLFHSNPDQLDFLVGITF